MPIEVSQGHGRDWADRKRKSPLSKSPMNEEGAGRLIDEQYRGVESQRAEASKGKEVSTEADKGMDFGELQGDSAWPGSPSPVQGHTPAGRRTCPFLQGVDVVVWLDKGHIMYILKHNKGAHVECDSEKDSHPGC